MNHMNNYKWVFYFKTSIYLLTKLVMLSLQFKNIIYGKQVETLENNVLHLQHSCDILLNSIYKLFIFHYLLMH